MRSEEPSTRYMMLQRAAVAADPLAHPVAQPARRTRRLLGEAQPEQRVHREGGVAHPGVAVVPVALAADLLGQRRGRRGDQRAGRGVGHQLQRDRRALDLSRHRPGVGGPASHDRQNATVSSNSCRHLGGADLRGGPSAARSSTTPRDLTGDQVDAARARPRRRPALGQPLVVGLAHRRAASAQRRRPLKTAPSRSTSVRCGCAAVVEPRAPRRPRSVIRPRTHRTIRTSRWRSVAVAPAGRHEVDDLAHARPR